jgi:hypothetical protein
MIRVGRGVIRQTGEALKGAWLAGFALCPKVSGVDSVFQVSVRAMLRRRIPRRRFMPPMLAAAHQVGSHFF